MRCRHQRCKKRWRHQGSWLTRSELVWCRKNVACVRSRRRHDARHRARLPDPCPANQEGACCSQSTCVGLFSELQNSEKVLKDQSMRSCFDSALCFVPPPCPREDVRQSFTVGRGRTTTSASKKSRPAGGTQSSSFQTYMKLKNSGMMKSGEIATHGFYFDDILLQRNRFLFQNFCRSNSRSACLEVQRKRLPSRRHVCVQRFEMHFAMTANVTFTDSRVKAFRKRLTGKRPPPPPVCRSAPWWPWPTCP